MNRLGSIVFSKATTRLCSKKCDPSKDKASKSDNPKGKGDKKDHCGRSKLKHIVLMSAIYTRLLVLKVQSPLSRNVIKILVLKHLLLEVNQLSNVKKTRNEAESTKLNVIKAFL